MSFEAKACFAASRDAIAVSVKSTTDTSGSFGPDWFALRAAKAKAALLAFASTERAAALAPPDDSNLSAFDPAIERRRRTERDYASSVLRHAELQPLISAPQALSNHRPPLQSSSARLGGGLHSFQLDAR